MQERRKFVRFQAFMRLVLKAIDDETVRIITKIQDLSRDGVGISFDKELEEGSTVDLEMAIPGDNMPVMASGEVAWTEKVAEGLYNAGIKFTKIESLDRSRLMDHVYNEWIKTKKSGSKKNK